MMHEWRDCSDESMRDLLPGYVLGTLTSAEYTRVSAHLTGCESCADEVRLIRLAGAAYAAPSVDIDAIVAALPQALGVSRPRLTVSAGGLAAGAPSRGLRARRWRFAAAVSFIVLGGISLVTLRGVMRDAAVTDYPAAAVDSALPSVAAGAAVVAGASVAAVPAQDVAVEAESVATPRDTRIGAAGLSIGAAGDLSDAQLQRLLRELEMIEALPSTEPAPSHHPMSAPDEPEDNN